MVKFSDNLSDFKDYLADESGIAQGTSATRIWFPTSHDEVVEVVHQAITEHKSVTVSGGGTGISGGRAPIKDWILATDEMMSIDHPKKEDWQDKETGRSYGVRFFEEDETNYLTVPVGMSLDAILRLTRERNLLYPPDPTERSSFIGGNFSTNASGARSFKFGPTRNWIHSAKVVLASGEDIYLSREEKKSIENGTIILEAANNRYEVPIPELPIPNVTKHVAGPVITNESDTIDIFIGTNGIYGIVTEITLKLLPLPQNIISMFVFCDNFKMASDLIRKCQYLRKSNSSPLPMSVEYLDSNAIKLMQMKDTTIDDAYCVILIEQDIGNDDEEDTILQEWNEIFEELGISNIDVALTHKENEHHKFLRHWVPEWIISTARSYGYPIVVSDTSVPHDRFAEFMAFIHDLEQEFQEAYPVVDRINTVLLGHIGDSHPHLALIPTNDHEAKLSQDMLNTLIDKTVELGGSIAAEHGLGKKLFDGKPAILKQYGDEGLEEIKKIKEVLDPEYLLCPGNIIPMLPGLD